MNKCDCCGKDLDRHIFCSNRCKMAYRRHKKETKKDTQRNKTSKLDTKSVEKLPKVTPQNPKARKIDTPLITFSKSAQLGNPPKS